jgi:KAP family P-loop domain
MSEHPASPILDIHQLVERYNPFDRSLVVRSHDVWASKFPDVPAINGHISAAIFKGIEQVKSGDRGGVLGVTITAEKGLGKSHLISRLRRQIKQDGSAFFVYMSETNYGDLNRINSMFLSTMAESLQQEGSSGARQWQELAALLLNEIFEVNDEPEIWIGKFPNKMATVPNFMTRLTVKVCERKPEITNPDVVQAIFWTLIPNMQSFAVNWLSGKSLGKTRAEAMDLPANDEGDREINALARATQILDLIGNYRTIVICLDEIEPKSSNSQGLTTPQVIASLAKDLYSKIKSGILIMATHPQTWQYHIKVMPQSESVIDRIGEKKFELKYLDCDDIVALISAWLQPFYAKHSLTPPSPTYPFNDKDLRELGTERPTVRTVLKWCAENWQVSVPVDEFHGIEVAFQEQMLALETTITDWMDDSKLIAKALRLAFETTKGMTIDGVLVEDIQDIKLKAVDRDYLDFRIVAQEGGMTHKIGVCVVQNSATKFVGAAMKRLAEYDKFIFTRGCLVRSKEVKPKTLGRTILDDLIANRGGEWVAFKPEEIKPLLAIRAVYDAYEDYEFSRVKIIEFIQKTQIAENNSLIKEILSDPSGEIPVDVIDEDSLLSIENDSATFTDDNVFELSEASLQLAT